jgi:hypothetical protein
MEKGFIIYFVYISNVKHINSGSIAKVMNAKIYNISATTFNCNQDTLILFSVWGGYDILWIYCKSYFIHDDVYVYEYIYVYIYVYRYIYIYAYI